MRPAVKVIVIESLSYTGTTWLNAVLGTHADAFALGPPDRVYRLRDGDRDDACRVHGRECAFWRGFWQKYDRGGNFFIQLAAHAGKHVIVTNNPLADGAGAELRHKDLVVKPVNMIRDGRALVASYCRHATGASVFEAITRFLQPSFGAFYFDPDDRDRLCIRYEDLIADPLAMLDRIGRFAGIRYTDAALRFWEHDHHLATGNAGTVALIKMGNGIDTGNLRGREFYAQQFEMMKKTGPAAFEDARWETELSGQDRFLFDLFCGADNQRFGYARDRFTLAEVDEYRRTLAHAFDSGLLGENPFPEIRRALAGLPAVCAPSPPAARVAPDAGPPGFLRRMLTRLRGTS